MVWKKANYTHRNKDVYTWDYNAILTADRAQRYVDIYLNTLRQRFGSNFVMKVNARTTKGKWMSSNFISIKHGANPIIPVGDYSDDGLGIVFDRVDISILAK